jgi:Flp pilus assembly protein TadD
MRRREASSRATGAAALLVATIVSVPGCAWQREPSKANSRGGDSWLAGWLSPSKSNTSGGTSGAAAAAAPVDSQLAPGDAAALCLETAQQFDQGDRPAEAVAQYERVLALRPDMPGVSARLAVLHGRLGNHELATRHFQRAFERTPRDGRLWNDYGYHHYQNGRWSEAERAFRESCRFEPGLERNHVNLGLALAQQNRLAEAYEAFAKAVSPGAAHSNIGMVLAQQGRSAEALDAFHRALDCEPNLTQTHLARDVVARDLVARTGATRDMATRDMAVRGPGTSDERASSGNMIVPAGHQEAVAPPSQPSQPTQPTQPSQPTQHSQPSPRGSFIR